MYAGANCSINRNYLKHNNVTYIYFMKFQYVKKIKYVSLKMALKPRMVKRQQETKKEIYTLFFCNKGLVKVIKLERHTTVTTSLCTTKCLPEILQEVNVRD